MKKIFIFFSLFVFSFPLLASAHSFGKLYNLPVPLWLYLYGSVAAMLVSFLFIGYFFNKKIEAVSFPEKNLSKFSFIKFLTSSKFVYFLKVVTFLFFVLTIVTGLFGDDSAYSNFNMTFFWIIFVLGMTYLSVIVGDIYEYINPWKTLTDWLVTKSEGPIWKYPKKLGYYPALAFYFIFIWIELVGGNTPFKLSIILLVYTILNDLGVVLLGSDAWFKYCEFFSVFFRMIGKISPIEYKDGKIFLRYPFVGLLKEKAENWSQLLFVLFMLSSTAFDGFKETLPWTRSYWGFVDNFLQPILGSNSYVVFETFGIILFLFVFLCIYLAFIYFSKKIAKSRDSLKELALNFAFTLIPIAFVYNIAHYYTLVFSEGPDIVRLLSDPFGFGWNIFGTANSYHSIILGANFVWHSEVAFILLGHIAAVYLSHVVALNIFKTNKKLAFWSQFPMLILMILYTVIGLWILSQPITG